MILRRKLLEKTPRKGVLPPRVPYRQHCKIRDALAEDGGPAGVRSGLWATWDPATQNVVPASVKFLTTTLRNCPASEIAEIERLAAVCVDFYVPPRSSVKFKAMRGHQFAEKFSPDWLRRLVRLAAVWHNTPGKLRESRRIVRALRKAGAKELIPVCCRPRIREKKLASV